MLISFSSINAEEVDPRVGVSRLVFRFGLLIKPLCRELEKPNFEIVFLPV
jgi:hypothetical protein